MLNFLKLRPLIDWFVRPTGMAREEDYYKPNLLAKIRDHHANEIGTNSYREKIKGKLWIVFRPKSARSLSRIVSLLKTYRVIHSLRESAVNRTGREGATNRQQFAAWKINSPSRPQHTPHHLPLPPPTPTLHLHPHPQCLLCCRLVKCWFSSLSTLFTYTYLQVRSTAEQEIHS